ESIVMTGCLPAPGVVTRADARCAPIPKHGSNHILFKSGLCAADHSTRAVVSGVGWLRDAGLSSGFAGYFLVFHNAYGEKAFGRKAFGGRPLPRQGGLMARRPLSRQGGLTARRSLSRQGGLAARGPRRGRVR